ncbi:MAG: DUF4176 domain-containing protein [Butyrivibrio sp.]|nr:DUF4176 domain-containing protein [Butyrivibrio sp.]
MQIKTLPIGTVVQLGSMKQKIMIVGRQQINHEENDRVYDYSGYLYPQGMDGDDVFLFDAEQIVMVYHIGYQDLDEIHQKFIVAEIAKETENEEKDN